MGASHDTTTTALPTLVAEKLAAFDRLEPAVEASFHFLEEVHGDKRFASFPVAETVHYLHALWICECKDRLLSVPGAVERYQGARGLAVLLHWQESGDLANLVALLCQQLDTIDVAQLSRQFDAARHADGECVRARRLAHGRLYLVNRGMNLLHALDALFALPAQAVCDAARAAAAQCEHTPEQITEQLRQLETPQYGLLRHPALAQRNMLVMNRLGAVAIAAVGDAEEPADEPATHVWRATIPRAVESPCAEQTIAGYVPLRAPWHNNPRGVRWVDRLEPVDRPTRERPANDSSPA